jgi:hypothetical protein
LRGLRSGVESLLGARGGARTPLARRGLNRKTRKLKKRLAGVAMSPVLTSLIFLVFL